jgi:hypothetical protein
MAVIDIEALNRAAKTYNSQLRTLPVMAGMDIAQRFGLNFVEVANEDVETTFLRKGGILRPYKAGANREASDLGKITERSLKPVLTYAEVNDNILNYKEKNVLSNAGEPVDHIAKKHPLERQIIETIVASYNEDVALGVFTYAYDPEGNTPSKAYNGFYTKLLALITAGEVAVAKKNMYNTEAFAAPKDATDTETYEKAVAFLSSAHPLLRAGAANWYIGSAPWKNIRAAYKNKVKSFNDPTSEQVMEALRDDAQFPLLNRITDPTFGIGDFSFVIRPGQLDLGVNTKAAAQFVQVRQYGRDPNDVQFWIQAAWDTRWKTNHPKLFLCNEKPLASVADLAGDY